MNEKISIIIPVYNVELYIRKCIKSILNQTYTNIEVILIDDGSPDNCGKICDAFAREDNRIKVIHQKNAGVCAARNAGLKIATGDYIGFVDPDDWVAPDMYEYLLNNLKKYDSDISCCRYYRVIPKERIYSFTDGNTYVYNRKEAIEELVNYFTIRAVFWNKLFKKEMFENIEFPVGMIYEGTYLVHKVFEKADKIVFLPDPKYYYYKYEQSYVNTITVKYQCDYIYAHISRYNDLNEKYPNLKEKMMENIIEQSINLVELCYKKKREIKANKEKIREIGNFIIDNYDYISNMKITNRITMKKLKYLTNLSTLDLYMAHYFKKVSIAFKKARICLRNFKNNLKRKSNKKRRTKFAVNIDDLSNEDKETFKKLHNEEIKILDEFVRICKKFNLKYFLYGGTLLGAVRHKGFIPWDDDVDIVMPREDYDKFAEIAQKELGKEFFYQTNKTDAEFNLLFAKIRLNNTYVREEKFDKKKMHKGIYIDILPLDLFPELTSFRQKIMLEKFNVLNCACQTGRCLSRHLLSKILYKWYVLFPNKHLQKKRDKFIKKACNDLNTKYVCSFGSHYRPLRKRILKREWFEDVGIEMEFEGKMYSVPKGWKEYLVHLFGTNYMEWPPVEKRINHFNFYEVKFEEEGERVNEKV